MSEEELGPTLSALLKQRAPVIEPDVIHEVPIAPTEDPEVLEAQEAAREDEERVIQKVRAARGWVRFETPGNRSGEAILVGVGIKTARRIFGRWELLVAPIIGRGEVWVSARRVILDEEIKGGSE